MEANKIEFRKISFSYNKYKLFYQFDLIIDENGLYLLKGENGKGKSTLMKLLTGIIDDYEGDIFVNEHNIKNLNTENISKIIHHQSQKTPIFHDSLNNNIFLGRIDIDDKVLRNLLTDFEISELYVLNQISDEVISGGQAQKIGIIRALLSKKKILIFDEPTANLDNKSIRVFKQYLKKITDKYIVIIITHDDYLDDLSNKIIFI